MPELLLVRADTQTQFQLRRLGGQRDSDDVARRGVKAGAVPLAHFGVHGRGHGAEARRRLRHWAREELRRGMRARLLRRKLAQLLALKRDEQAAREVVSLYGRF